MKAGAFPEFDVVESHIRRARIERAVVLAELIVKAIDATVRGTTWFARAVAANVALKDRAFQGNPFYKGPVARH